MFDLGTQELILIFIVAFLVFGPKKLPELGRTIGKGLRELKTAMRGITESFEDAGSDVTNELREAKNSLEESIAETLDSTTTGDDAKKTAKYDDEGKGPVTAGEDDKEKKEMDKDG